MTARVTFFDGLVFNLFGISRTGADRQYNRAYGYQKYYGLQYIHAGHLDLSINNGPMFHLKGPFAFLTTPNLFYEYYSPPGTERLHYFACFTGERVTRFYEGGLFNFNLNQPYFPIASPDSFSGEMLELILALQNGEKYTHCVTRLEHLLLSIQESSGFPRAGGFYQVPLEELSQKIMLTPEREWDFNREAAALSITPKHFIRIFRNMHGMPPHRFVIRQRLFKAAESLIRESNLPVKSIAAACGFNNEFYFSRMFKKHYGLSPDLYRRNRFTGSSDG